MRFCTFLVDGSARVGISRDATADVVDLRQSLIARGEQSQVILTAAQSVRGIVDLGEPVLSAARALLAESDQQRLVSYRPSEVALLAPIPNPRTVYCIGINYVAHSAEFQGSNAPIPKVPVVFSKPVLVTGPGDLIETHGVRTRELDYEAELAVVIGKRGRDLVAEDAKDYVFGYTCLNDVTARDLQRLHSQWLIGKSLDGFCPIGPAIVERDDLAWPPALSIECRVNGELRQSDNTSSMIFGIPTLIECLSAGRTLYPGDLIATGTPSGVGMAMDPPGFLQEGDAVEVSIEGIGELVNRCGATDQVIGAR